MTEKNTYWIADAEGVKALVEGADARDHWTRGRGWAESTEPQRQEFVWLSNENPDLGPTRLTWEAAQDPAWIERGFRPGPPPEPVNPALSPERPVRPAAEPKSPPKSAPVSAGDKKNQE